MSNAIARRVKYASLALVALGSVGGAQMALAEGTDAGTDITNRATVSYSVLGNAQTPINSSPLGNTVAGPTGGADTVFEVDRKILHTVAELGGGAETTTTGASNVVARFTVTNTGNGAQGYQLIATNTTTAPIYAASADSTDVTIVGAFHDVDEDGVYDAVTDLPYINSLAEDDDAQVIVVVNVPLSTTNGQFANVQLAAAAAVASTNGATLEVQSNGVDDPLVVDVVFADAGAVARNGIHEAVDQFAIQSAALRVTKSAIAVYDPINNTTNPKAIPGATVRYTIRVQNTSTSREAQGVVVTDVVNAITPYMPGTMMLGNLARTDSAADADGASFDAGTNTVTVTIGTIAESSEATVTFDVTIPATP